MQYDEARTRSIVGRFVALEPLLRAATVGGWTIGFGALMALLVELWIEGGWWLGGLLGAALGYAIGAVFAAFFALVAEALAQGLLAQAEVREILKRSAQ